MTGSLLGCYFLCFHAVVFDDGCRCAFRSAVRNQGGPAWRDDAHGSICAKVEN